VLFCNANDYENGNDYYSFMKTNTKKDANLPNDNDAVRNL